MIQVSCAVIEQQIKNECCFLVCQRSESSSVPLKWEFPGGKLEAGETHETCVVREIKEELGLIIEVANPLTPVSYRYPTAKIELCPFYCRILSGHILLSVHVAYLWQPKNLLTELDWAPADLPVVHQLLKK